MLHLFLSLLRVKKSNSFLIQILVLQWVCHLYCLFFYLPVMETYLETLLTIGTAYIQQFTVDIESISTKLGKHYGHTVNRWRKVHGKQ